MYVYVNINLLQTKPALVINFAVKTFKSCQGLFISTCLYVKQINSPTISKGDHLQEENRRRNISHQFKACYLREYP